MLLRTVLALLNIKSNNTYVSLDLTEILRFSPKFISIVTTFTNQLKAQKNRRNVLSIRHYLIIVLNNPKMLSKWNSALKYLVKLMILRWTEIKNGTRLPMPHFIPKNCKTQFQCMHRIYGPHLEGIENRIITTVSIIFQ